ncbi:hypothetical protein ScPMuIL_009265 [Solemya velum]
MIIMLEPGRGVLHLLKSRISTRFQMCKRYGSSWKKRMLKKQDQKEDIFHYVGENAKRTDRVYVWGCASTGALGIKTYMKPEKNQIPLTSMHRPARLRFLDIHDIKVTDVSCGYGFTLFVTKSRRGHRVFGTGVNTDSQIGFHEMPRNSGRILDYLIEPSMIDLPLLHPESTRVLQVSCGRAHSLLLSDREGVFALGNNAYGQCGRPIVDGELYRQSPAVHKVKDLPENICKVHCGQDHSLFLTESGELYSCGLGADGQTGLNNFMSVGRVQQVEGDIEGTKIVDVMGKGDCTLALSEEGQLFAWGNSEYGQLSMVTDHTQVNVARCLPVQNCGKVIKAAAGGSICALLNDKGEVYVWGFGILGKGPKLESSVTPTQIPGILFGRNELQPDTIVVDICCGLNYFAALTDKGDIYTWGRNKLGCLGLSHRNDQYFPLKVNLPGDVNTISCGVDHMAALAKSYS